MKRYGNLFDKVCDMDNLRLAHKNARRNKSFYKEVVMVNANEDYYLNKVQEMLTNKTYKTSKYVIFDRADSGKIRQIYKLPYYPDRIVQWALMQIIEPFLLNKLIADTYSAIPGRGIHYGLKRVRKAIEDTENTQYCLKFDIRKYYPSINHTLLKHMYANIFKDNGLLWLIDEIIDSVEMSEGTGIPIGNYLSQWSANLFLSDFDHWAKEEKRLKYYFRYMDDIVILAKSKEELHTLLHEIKQKLDEKRLVLKHDYQIFPVDIRGIDFLGYRIFRNYSLLRKSTAKNFKRKMLKLKKKSYLSKSDNASIQSYKGWLMWCNSFRLQNKYLEGLVKQ